MKYRATIRPEAENDLREIADSEFSRLAVATQ